MDKAKADWCRQFSELLLASGKWKDIETTVWLAYATYPNAQQLTPAQAAWALADIGKALEPAKVYIGQARQI